MSGEIGFGDHDLYAARHDVLKRNFAGFESYPVPIDAFLNAIAKDKKNVGSDLMLILPDQDARLQKTPCANDDQFRELCTVYLERARAA